MKTIAIVLALLGLLAGPVSGVPVDPDAEDGIAAVLYMNDETSGDHQTFILCTNGDVWRIDLWGDYSWQHYAIINPPIAVADIMDWGAFTLIAQDGQLWTCSRNSNWEWLAVDPVPCFTPIQNQPQSLGSVKKGYR